MMITAVQKNNYTAFKADKKQEVPASKKPVYDKNPIKKNGERANAILATAVAGLYFGVRLLAAIADDGDGAQFVGEMAGKVSRKIQRKLLQPGEKLSFAQKIGGPIAVIAGFVAAMALLYTIFNAPKAMYNAKINTFKKTKEMDVYIKGNAVETELYNQMNEKAKNATKEEKECLGIQYAKLKAAKNVVPDFVRLKQPYLKN
ncbi:MAG: hypothetical protein KHX03_01205 [Clostridium sp.]|nr:hypothetical protein [Clostridium sp.]